MDAGMGAAPALRRPPRGGGWRRFVLIALASCALPGAAAGIQQWRDADGHVHFGDAAPAGVAATAVEVKPNVYSSPSTEALAKLFEASNDVVLYSAAWCGYCRQARNYFTDQRIPFAEYDVETSAKGRDDYARLGAHGVPVIVIGRQRMNGFSAAAFQQIYRAR